MKLKLNENNIWVLSEKYKNNNELFSDYLKNTISIDELIEKVGGLNNLATKKELEMFLNNSFMISIKADEENIDKQTLIKKIKEILKKYK